MSTSDNDDNGSPHESETEQEHQARAVRKAQLEKIKRARSKLMVCFCTLPLYAIALLALLNNGQEIVWLMAVYMAVYAFFAINMVVKLCPVCRHQFFVRGYFLNFFASHCVHCGVSCKAKRKDRAASKKF